ncbi:MAG: hypothetical protein AB1627_15550 [Chloroflexota bacterium]
MTTAPAARPWPGALDWGGDWLADATGELAHLGFVLRDGMRTGSVPGPRLLVALRDRPTLEHFDPEEVTYWVVRDGRGRVGQVTRDTPLPISGPFSWGHVRVTDRVPVSNEFLTFGGSLLGAARDEHVTVLAFTSRAPIVRWAGHSQGVDPYADEIGAFFARLMVPIDYQAGAEARIAAATPEALYATFLRHAGRRLRPGGALRESEPALASFVDHECRRLAFDDPPAWREGEALLDWLELG